MTPARHERWQALTRCHGFSVVASDGLLGVVETPLFPPHVNEPDYLIIRVPRRSRDRRPVVSTGLVEHVDSGRRLIRLRGTRSEIAHLPEYLPLTGRGPAGRRSA